MRVLRLVQQNLVSIVLFGLTLALLIVIGHAHAQNNEGAFALQVSPSPIIDAIKPGVEHQIDFQIRNQGTHTEQLKIGFRSFKVAEDTGTIQLTDETPAEISNWVQLSDPLISVEPGQAFTEHLKINPPSDVGFSYSFAIVISRDKEPVSNEGKTKLKGSVAIFTLLTVDRPGAERKFEVAEFSSKRRSYEYLPATFNIRLKNTGNTIVQPYGNVYIQRSPNSSQPISVLKLNDTGAYLLPGVSRSFPLKWSDGFPAYNDVKTADNAGVNQQLHWDWGQLQQFRFGRYYAKLVAVYNDGQRDIPIETTVSFWVIPWKLLLGLAVLVTVLVVGVVTIIRKSFRTVKRKKHTKKKDEKTGDETSDEA